MDQKISYKEFLKTEFSSVNKFRWPIILWLILITVVLILVTNGLTFFDILQSILMTIIISFFFYFNIEYFNKMNLNILPDLIKIGCLLLLVLIFGYWGFVYTVFFLIILIIDAFSYSLRDFIIVIGMIAVAFFLIWLLNNDPIYQIPLIKNTFFLVIANAIFALGILLRTLARESLVAIKRGKNLEKSQKFLSKENDEINTIFNNMENSIISLDEKNNIYFINISATKTFPILKRKSIKNISIDDLKLVDSTGRRMKLREIVDKTDDKSYRSDLKIYINKDVINYSVLVDKAFDDDKSYKGAVISLHSLTNDELLEKSKIEFSSLASHEIRTPLTIIEGYIYIMLTNNTEFVYNETTKKYLTIIHETTSDLIKLSNSILSMSKLDEGSMRVDIEKTNLENLIKKESGAESELAKLKDLKINYVLNKVPNIDTDPTKVSEILRNLIENAIKFSNQGIISVILDQVGDEVIISVEDSGIGIPDSAKDKIFSKFFQVESYETRKKSGSGLGLYLSKSLARRIGGDLVLEATSKMGSRFNLILPIKYSNLEDIKKNQGHKLKEFIEGF